MKLKVKKLHKDAKLPTHGHPGDAGIDFYCIEDVVFPPGKQARVRTGVAIEIPEGYAGLIWDKSSVAFNMGLTVLGGVIDSGYRGEIIMCLFNILDKEVVLPKGRKVAQMLIQKFAYCDILEVDETSTTVRGERLEGSTGHE